MNSGTMPRTDYRYEEFEGYLGSFYITLLPLKDSMNDQDRVDFETAVQILNRFAERHGVQSPVDAVQHPRPTREDWGQPRPFVSCWTTLDAMASFWRAFSVGENPKTTDGQERKRLGQLLLGILYRHHVISAKFEQILDPQTGVMTWTPVEALEFNRDRKRLPLSEVISA